MYLVGTYQHYIHYLPSLALTPYPPIQHLSGPPILLYIEFVIIINIRTQCQPSYSFDTYAGGFSRTIMGKVYAGGTSQPPPIRILVYIVHAHWNWCPQMLYPGPGKWRRMEEWVLHSAPCASFSPLPISPVSHLAPPFNSNSHPYSQPLQHFQIPCFGERAVCRCKGGSATTKRSCEDELCALAPASPTIHTHTSLPPSPIPGPIRFCFPLLQSRPARHSPSLLDPLAPTHPFPPPIPRPAAMSTCFYVVCTRSSENVSKV